MGILKYKRILAKILLIAVIFTYMPIHNLNIYATETVSVDMNKVKQDIEKWLNDKARYEIMKTEYNDKGEDSVVYTAKMPSVDTQRHPNIVFNPSLGKYEYRIENSQGQVVKTISFNVDVAIANSTNGFTNGLTENNYKNYSVSQISTIMENNDNEYLKLISLEDVTERDLAYIVELEDGTKIISDSKEFKVDNGNLIERLLGWVKGKLFDLWNVAMNAVAGIINDLLLWMADGFHELIDSIFGAKDPLTIYKVIFGKIDKLSIDYWGIAGSSNNIGGTEGETESENEENPTGIVDNAPASALKNIVSYWYNVIRGIVISIYLVMFLYIGVKILLASTGKSAQKYKSMLSSWLVGLIILFFFPYVMKYVVIINDGFVEMIGSSASGSSEDDDKDTMYQIRMQAEEDRNLALTIVYIILLGQLVILLGVYYKRVFMMAFLITIFPIVAGLYVWEAVNKGKSSALGAWTKEYVVLVFTQTIHAVVYVILVDGAYAAFKNSGDWFVFIISVVFLFEAEKIVRAIFGLKSSANTIGDLATVGAAAWGASKAMGKMFKPEGSGKSKDEEDKAKVDKQVDDARKNTAINSALSNAYSTRSSSSSSSTTSSSSSSSSGSSGGGAAALVPSNMQNDLEAAQAVVAQEALKGKTKKGLLKTALNATTGGIARASGITLGVTSGLASGSLQTGFSNAVIANEIAGSAAKLPNAITGYAIDAYAGRRLKRKIQSGALDQKFKEAGFDIDGKFDADDEISKAKTRIIREALAAQGAATRWKGKAKGELEFIEAIERERRKENL